MQSLLVRPIEMAEQVLENLSFLQTFLVMFIMEEEKGDNSPRLKPGASQFNRFSILSRP